MAMKVESDFRWIAATRVALIQDWGPREDTWSHRVETAGAKTSLKRCESMPNLLASRPDDHHNDRGTMNGNRCQRQSHFLASNEDSLDEMPLSEPAANSLSLIEGQHCQGHHHHHERGDELFFFIGVFLIQVAIGTFVELLPTLFKSNDLDKFEKLPSILLTSVHGVAVLSCFLTLSAHRSPLDRKRKQQEEHVGFMMTSAFLVGNLACLAFQLGLLLNTSSSWWICSFVALGPFLALITVSQTRWILSKFSTTNSNISNTTRKARLICRYITVKSSIAIGLIAFIVKTIQLDASITENPPGGDDNDDDYNDSMSVSDSFIGSLHLSRSRWNTLMGVSAIVAFTSAVITCVKTLCSQGTMDDWAYHNNEDVHEAIDFQSQKTLPMSNKAIFLHRYRALFPSHLILDSDDPLVMLIQILTFIGLREAYMVKYFLKDSVVVFLGFQALPMILLGHGTARFIGSWLASQLVIFHQGHLVTALACGSELGLLLILGLWQYPSGDDVAMFHAVSFIWGISAAIWDFTALDFLVTSQHQGQKPGIRPRSGRSDISSLFFALHIHFGFSVIFLLDCLGCHVHWVLLLVGGTFLVAVIHNIVLFTVLKGRSK